jgi:hypothetical protein
MGFYYSLLSGGYWSEPARCVIFKYCCELSSNIDNSLSVHRTREDIYIKLLLDDDPLCDADDLLKKKINKKNIDIG